MESFFSAVEQRWPAGQDDYHWDVLPEPEDAREYLAEPYRELVTRPGLAPVPPRWTHITVYHDAPVGEISREALEETVSRVRDGCRKIRPFNTWVRRPETWHNAVVCPVYPGQRLRQLWTLVTTVAAFTGRRRRSDNYCPHMSLAYATGHVDHGPLREWLADRNFPEPGIPVRELALVRQRHDGTAITWDVLEKIPLGTAGLPSPPGP